MKIEDDVRAVLEAGRLAHFTTLREGGSPHTTIVWVGVDSGPAGDQVVIGKMAEDAKVRNIRRDPRVSLSLEAAGTTHGLGNYLVVEGTAVVTPGGGADLLQVLAHRYLGPDVEFPPKEVPGPGMVIRITPTRIRGNGPWS